MESATAEKPTQAPVGPFPEKFEDQNKINRMVPLNDLMCETQDIMNQTNPIKGYTKVKEENKYEIPPSEYIWDAPYLKQNQIFPMCSTAKQHPTMQMLKMFSRKLTERSNAPEEYIKPIDVNDLVKYDRDELWKTSNDVMNQYIPPIENGASDSSTGLKTSISPIQAKRMKESEQKEYYDPLKRYATRAENEGNHIERNPLNNHKLINNNYFLMSRVIGSYWDKVDKESYFRNRYDKMDFDPTQRDSGFSTNLHGNIDFTEMMTQHPEFGLPHPKEDYKQTEYRNTYWRNRGFPFVAGPKPIAHTARTMQIPHYN